MIDQIEKKYGGILVPLDELQSFIKWYEQAEHHSDWDDKKYNFCLDCLEYAAKAGIKQNL